jgi:LssY C-terminus
MTLALTAIVVLAAFYALAAYIVLPAAWKHHERQPGLAAKSAVTVTPQNIPGDPINVGFVSDQEDLVRAMHEAGWVAADEVTLRSSIGIVGSVLFDRPYSAAPVSPLYYDGRVQDLAYQKADGVSADRRHHVRLWRVLEAGVEGRPVWLGASTFDRGVGLSHYTGQVTHRIAPQIDQEREYLLDELKTAGMVQSQYSVSGVGPTLAGRNGEGNPYQTDGDIWIAELVVNGQRRTEPAEVLDTPMLVAVKNSLWNGLSAVLGR